jgi:hypothetical protein
VAELAGNLAFDTALATAKERQKQADWRNAGLRMLGAAAPDLAARVRDEEIGFEEAKKQQHEERRRAEHVVRDSVLLGLATGSAAWAGLEQAAHRVVQLRRGHQPPA